MRASAEVQKQAAGVRAARSQPFLATHQVTALLGRRWAASDQKAGVEISRPGTPRFLSVTRYRRGTDWRDWPREPPVAFFGINGPPNPETTTAEQCNKWHPVQGRSRESSREHRSDVRAITWRLLHPKGNR